MWIDYSLLVQSLFIYSAQAMRKLLLKSVFVITVALALVPVGVQAQGRPGERGRGIPDVRGINQEEGREIINNFRRQRLEGDFVFDFDLSYLPRRGETIFYQGVLWGTWNDKGPLFRMILWSPSAPDKLLLNMIVQGGEKPMVWRQNADGSVEELSSDAMGQPLIPGANYTAFDLIMPFVYWDEFYYEGSRRVAGQPAHVFAWLAPEEFVVKNPHMARVEGALHAHYHALLEANVYDSEDQRTRSINVLSFREVDNQYIVRTIDLIERPENNKSRFRVVSAAVGIHLDPSVFDPKLLSGPLPSLEGIPFKSL